MLHQHGFILFGTRIAGFQCHAIQNRSKEKKQKQNRLIDKVRNLGKEKGKCIKPLAKIQIREIFLKQDKLRNAEKCTEACKGHSRCDLIREKIKSIKMRDARKKNARCEIKNMRCEIKENARFEIEYCEIQGQAPWSRNLTRDTVPTTTTTTTNTFSRMNRACL